MENNVYSSKQKGCTLLSMIFLPYLLCLDSSKSIMVDKKGQKF